jgi:hypothetical protein
MFFLTSKNGETHCPPGSIPVRILGIVVAEAVIIILIVRKDASYID